MSKPKGLWKTTIVIWSDFDPQEMEIDDLAREAMSGDAYCDSQVKEYVTDSKQFPPTEFFEDESEETAERWTEVYGTMPGEPMLLLDGDEETAKAAVIELDTDEPEKYEARFAGEARIHGHVVFGGHVIGKFVTTQEAKTAAEEKLLMLHAAQCKQCATALMDGGVGNLPLCPEGKKLNC